MIVYVIMVLFGVSITIGVIETNLDDHSISSPSPVTIEHGR